MHSHSSCLIFPNLSFMWVIISTGQQQNAPVSLQNTWTTAPHLQQAMKGFQTNPEKMWTFHLRQCFFISELPNTRKTTCAVSSPPLEAAPGDVIIPKYRVKLCLRAEKLFMGTGTPATLLVPRMLIWVMGNSSSHLVQPLLCCHKRQNLAYWEGDLGQQQLLW